MSRPKAPGNILCGVCQGSDNPSDALETRTAERDRALELLEALERQLTQTGGYMTPERQAELLASRALLVEQGRRNPEPIPAWKDRV